jgi:hypothetical protein
MSSRIASVSINAGRTDTRSYWPYYGLTLLATLLKDRHEDVRVFDQSSILRSGDSWLTE